MLISVVMAADSGTTVAIILALIALVGTLAAHVVAFYKIREERKSAIEELQKDREVSKVEVAQNVMLQTVTMLEVRLKTESEANEVKIKNLRESYEADIARMKKQHEQDVKRLEKRIDQITEENRAYRASNLELTQQIQILRRERDADGRPDSG